MLKKSLLLSVLIFMVSALTGCITMRPAVSPPPPSSELQQNDDKNNDGSALDVDAEKPVQDLVVQEEEPATESQEEPEINNDLELPDDAFPLAALPVAPVAFLPNDGPAPKGEEPVSTSEGWRVQALLAENQEEADKAREEIESVSEEKVHISWLDGKYSVLVGNYTDKLDAEPLKKKLLKKGFEASTIVQAPIVNKPSSETEVTKEIVYGWRVQVMSLVDMASARAELSGIESKTGYKAYVEEIASSFKIRVGNFLSREEAMLAKEKIEKSGYPGVFPVETRIEKP